MLSWIRFVEVVRRVLSALKSGRHYIGYDIEAKLY